MALTESLVFIGSMLTLLVAIIKSGRVLIIIAWSIVAFYWAMVLLAIK